MSGQPYRYAKDVENFRNDYMESLALRSNLDDMNLQANKQYKETGSLPPKSSMKDMRTTSEMLADTEKLKLSIVGELKDVCTPQMALSVVQRIQQSPLNADGSFFTWFAQNSPELVSQLKKKYKFGIVGNDNDVEQMVLFLTSIFTKTRDMNQSVKSAFDRPAGTLAIGLNEGDLTNLRHQFDSIEYKLVSSLGQGAGYVPDTESKVKIIMLTNQIRDQFDFLSTILDTTTYNKIKEIFLRHSFLSSNIPLRSGYQQIDVNYMGYQAINEFIDKIPSASSIRTLLDQLNKSEKNKSHKLSVNILTNIAGLLPTVNDSRNVAQIISDVIQVNGSPPPPSLQINLTGQQQQVQPGGHPPQGPPQQQPPTINQHQYPNVVTQNAIAGDLCSMLITYMNASSQNPALQDNRDLRLDFLGNCIDSVEQSMTDRYDRHANGIGWRNEIGYSRVDLGEMIAQLTHNFNLGYTRSHTFTVDEARAYIRHNNTTGMVGFGLHKRRGRPKGSGIVKPLSERIDNTKGIKQGHIHVPFGKYILNKNKLDSDQVYFKHLKGYGVKGFPATKVSSKLGSVLRTIIGGGVPKFEDLNNLSESEKEYLHKVAIKVGIMDKLSIPAPSKDKLEQDIHQFEVMKGELLSGNDSPDLIKKFKLVLLRLSKNGTIPKREASELLEDLVLLGH